MSKDILKSADEVCRWRHQILQIDALLDKLANDHPLTEDVLPLICGESIPQDLRRGAIHAMISFLREQRQIIMVWLSNSLNLQEK